MYETMLKIQRFEEELHLLFLQGELPGTLHLYTGQEAVAFARTSSEPRLEEALEGVYVAEGGS